MGAELVGVVNPTPRPPSAGVIDVTVGAPGGPDGVMVGDVAQNLHFRAPDIRLALCGCFHWLTITVVKVAQTITVVKPFFQNNFRRAGT